MQAPGFRDADTRQTGALAPAAAIRARRPGELDHAEEAYFAEGSDDEDDAVIDSPSTDDRARGTGTAAGGAVAGGAEAGGTRAAAAGANVATSFTGAAAGRGEHGSEAWPPSAPPSAFAGAPRPCCPLSTRFRCTTILSSQFCPCPVLDQHPSLCRMLPHVSC